MMAAPAKEGTMISALFNSTTIPVLEQVAVFAQARHTVLAGNLANFDTPGYRVRDLPPAAFEAKLREAIDQSRSGIRQNSAALDCYTSRYATSAIDAAASAASMRSEKPLAHVSRDLGGIVYHDDSDVSIEQQVTEMTKNQSRHNLALAIMTSQFRLLQTAISERV
jgi:flagellar basal-body rod protein FlgB